ncbi:MAG TPA: cysteine--tRNA ligase [Candidatus Agrococcus pullicola]|uniref:Cysteine--tRNA ligase n=1 Tax=Candidatus Agrococcus pullicola TaxID=2838429 RepID=A0A9D1YT15_9MICO|nr:cysteine--tRNA ligase [Candidatus Agrococcus pullicola]
MTVRIYDSRSQTVDDFSPVVPGEVSIYVCGPTVQSAPHIGHVRSALVYDVWQRWFAYRGYRTTLVRNVTDIDDKVLANATEQESWFALAYRIEREFNDAYRAVGILPPTYEPRATGSVPEMLELIGELIDRGHAYPASDGSADVYFDVRSWPEYGALTRQSVDDMEDAADADPRGKRDPRDFALWKSAKSDEPQTASWNSPWGPGRPGWHIECSAMSRKYLGDEFDIHGGGIDLRFPHHENELAQSSAAGLGFARVWAHNGAVTVNGTKMSKSLGNSIYADELIGQVRPIVVRYFLLAPHYRSVIDVRVVDGQLQQGSLAEADAAFRRIEDFLERASDTVAPESAEVPSAFAVAMDDDLATPQAVAVIHDTVRAGNTALDRDDTQAAAVAAAEVLAMLRVLGLDPSDEQWVSERGDSAKDAALATLVEALIRDRSDARAARDFARADSVRDTLADAGIALEDGKDSTTWSIA